VLYRHVASIDSPGEILVKKLLLQVVEDMDDFEPNKEHLGRPPLAHGFTLNEQLTVRSPCATGMHHVRCLSFSTRLSSLFILSAGKLKGTTKDHYFTSILLDWWSYNITCLKYHAQELLLELGLRKTFL
jgi:hypothetical protein